MMVGVPVTVCAYAGTPRRAGPIGELVPTAPRWWHATVAFGIGFDRQHLMDRDTPVIETVRRGCHVQAPDASALYPDLVHRRVPVFLKVRDPRLQGLRVVLPK